MCEAAMNLLPKNIAASILIYDKYVSILDFGDCGSDRFYFSYKILNTLPKTFPAGGKGARRSHYNNNSGYFLSGTF
jgi:hypothetical protein